ncbi:MAG: serine/threonine-protein kinase [Cyanobacteria bacterium P01_D01_bin.44]
MQLTPLGGRYKIVSQLGSGGFSRTFLVQDLHLPGNPQCVIKQLKPQATEADSLEMARRLFDTEANALYELGNHPQIPALLAHFEESQEFYLAQEFVEGVQLSHQIVLGKPWSEAKTVFLLREILEVLSFVHEQQAIHRDVKPSNLIRRLKDGKIVLIDFGAVKQMGNHPVELEPGMTNLTIAIGTQGYMPNEQLAGKPRFSSDVYAVGMIGIRALTGVHPKKLDEDPRTSEIDWHKHAPWVSEGLKEILDRMVRYDFRDRYPTATEALAALQSLPIQIDDEAIRAELVQGAAALVKASDAEPETDSQKMTQPRQEGKISAKVDLAAASADEEVDGSNSISGASVADPTDFLNLQAVATSPEGGDLTTMLPKPRRPWLVKPLAAIATVATLSLAAIAVTAAAVSPQLSGRLRSLQPAFTEPEDFTALGEPILLSRTVSKLLLPIDQAELLRAQADDLRTQGDHDTALGVYDEAIQLQENSAPLYQVVYDAAGELQQNLAAAYWGLCDSLNALEEIDRALVACNDALSFDPNYAEAINSKGNTYELQGRRPQALRLYQQASLIKPDLADAWLGQGRVLQSFGRSVEALRSLDEAIDLNRDSAEAWAIKGEALWNLGRYDQAIAALDKALDIEPEHPEASQLRQKAREDLGR